MTQNDHGVPALGLKSVVTMQVVSDKMILLFRLYIDQKPIRHKWLWMFLAIPACEETVRQLIAVASHSTPGVNNVSFDQKCPVTKSGPINGNWIEKIRKSIVLKRTIGFLKEDYVPRECDF